MKALAQDVATGVSFGSLPTALQYGGWAVALVLLPAFAVLWRRLVSIEDARVAEMQERSRLEARIDELERGGKPRPPAVQ